MKHNCIAITLLFLTLAISSKSYSKDESTELDGPYLGQKPPGLIPELFDPDLIQTEHREAEAAFTPDLKEFYFRRRGGEYKKNTLVVIRYENNRWIESEVPPRAGDWVDVQVIETLRPQ